MTEDELAEAINKAAEKCTIAVHEALTEQGVPTTMGNLFATTMVFAVTMCAVLTRRETDETTVRSFREGLHLFRQDEEDRHGATLQ